MFTRAKIYCGSTYLENHLSANDYYAEGERIQGRWIGKAAESLGLDGVVQANQFEALRTNYVPGSKHKLTPRTKGTRQPTTLDAERSFRRKHGRPGVPEEIEGHRATMGPQPNRVAFYDFQCSAQKSVSIMAILGGDKRLLVAHERASQIAFAELERFAARQNNTPTTRARVATGNLCAAAFTHDTSRALDPQLHTHFVVANATQDKFERWYALDEYLMIKAIRYCGKVYQNELAKGVRQCGYDIEEVRNDKRQITGFEIAGVSEEIRERFSKRRLEVEAGIEQFKNAHGREPTAAEIAVITRETRSAKLAEISSSDVHSRQIKQLSPGELAHLQLLCMKARNRPLIEILKSTSPDEGLALRFSADHLFERASVLPQYEILAEALNQALGSVDLEILKSKLFLGGPSLVRLTDSANPLLSEYGTKRGLQLEQWAVAFVDATQGKYAPLNAEFKPALSLSLEQRRAVRAILSTPDQVFGLRGLAGAGKTTALKEVHRGLVEAGKDVYYIAPTAAAADVLRREGFANATTVSDFLRNASWRDPLGNAVVICDEAGLKSNQQGADLLHLAQQFCMRVVLVGDVRQHVSVEAGDFLRVLETHSKLNRCEISEIRRQQSPGYKDAVVQMAAGDALGGLQALDCLGWLKEGNAEYLKAAAKDYLRLSQVEADSCLVVAPTWAENHQLTAEIRSALKAEDRLTGEATSHEVFDSLQWTVQQRANPLNYAPGHLVYFNRDVEGCKKGERYEVRRLEWGSVVVAGPDQQEHLLKPDQAKFFEVGRSRTVELLPGDKILIRTNNRAHNLINGHVLNVAWVEPDGSIRTWQGITIPREFSHWCHGYVVTSHKSQGRTCDHVIVAAERLDAKAAYVSCSRGRLTCSVHTPDKKRLLESLPEGNRRAALDALTNFRVQRTAVERSLTARVAIWARCTREMVQQTVVKTGKAVAEQLEEVRQIVHRWQWRRQLAMKKSRRVVDHSIDVHVQQHIAQQQNQSRGIRM